MSAKVVKKASELAQAIAECKELENFRLAEAKLRTDPEAYKLFVEVQRLQQMAQSSQTPEAMEKLEEAFNRLAENPVGKEYLEANRKFSQLLETVNSLLQEAIEGPRHGGCEGCSGCSF